MVKEVTKQKLLFDSNGKLIGFGNKENKEVIKLKTSDSLQFLKEESFHSEEIENIFEKS